MQGRIPQQTDEELVLTYRQTGNRWPVGELFKRHSLMCFTVCMKYLKQEDAAHDATMAVFEQLFTYLQTHEVHNFRSWLHTVCKNHCLMLLRKPVRETSLGYGEDEKEGTGFMESGRFMHQEDNAAEQETKLVALEEAVAALKDQQRQCIALFYLELKSYEEITRITGYSLNEVKSHIQNGRRNLALALNKKGIVPAAILLAWIQQVV